jgi:AmmeMemoRadiSam system protein A
MLNPEQRRYLLDLARRSIVHGLERGAPLAVELSAVEADLRRMAACFVTLEIQGRLRGCIGMLEPVRPLAEDVAHNAYAAAFSDPRFPPLQAGELEGLDIHISVLGAPAAMEIASEADLLRQLRPGVDGLILQEGSRRATFLPSVWGSLPEPVQFVAHLKQKAGWPAGYWSPGIRAFRYETEQFE